jgi:WD40 repeat protein
MQVRVYDVASMSCSYVLAGHTEIVVCLDTCVSASGKKLVVTGSKDNTVSLMCYPKILLNQHTFLWGCCYLVLRYFFCIVYVTFGT